MGGFELARMKVLLAGAGILLAAGLMVSRAQERSAAPADAPRTTEEANSLPVSDPNCSYFGPEREAYRNPGGALVRAAALTKLVGAQLPPISLARADAAPASTTLPSVPGGSRTGTTLNAPENTIDKYIFPALATAGVAPAPPTTDYEFVRRIYLDLTGRIPTPDQVTSFVNDTSANKRPALVDTLVGSPAWVDKWTIFFGDLYQNNSRNTQIVRYIQGVMAFNSFVRTALTNNTPYDQVARQMIQVQGDNSYTSGELNFLVGGVVTGGPVQDIFDQQTVNTSEAFLGISHINCLLCHDGRGHLDAISLWGYSTSRYQAWGLSSFMSHTQTTRTATPAAVNGQPYWWGLANNTKGYTTDYALNTLTGNRPARQPASPSSPKTIPPTYIFDGSGVSAGQDYRSVLAQKITSDFQFARATVNYLWEYFFTVGLVSPSNQFDPMRQDPNNPPSNCPSTTPCTLQASNPQLLNALAQDFVDSGYNLQTIMKEIVNSQAYQLSARYNGTWDPTTANLFGRKLVRRLWSEEFHDAITQSSGVVPTYNNADWGPVSLAMQFPEPLNTPNGPATNLPVSITFMDTFLRGNRDDQPRSSEGAITQALDLMNDPFIMSRLNLKGSASSLLVKSLAMPASNDGSPGGLIDTLFMNILSRHPTTDETNAALGNLKNNRTTEAQTLMWSLYNKVDFIFNY
jgi:hypothetical protein